MSASEPAPATAISVPMPQVVFVPLKGKVKLSKSQSQTLRQSLEKWREGFRDRSPHGFLSVRVYFSDTYIKKLVENGGKFLQETVITPTLIKQIIQWNLASEQDMDSICKVISDWRIQASAEIFPGSGKGRSKRSRVQPPPPEDPSRQSEAVRPINLINAHAVKQIDDDLTPRPSPSHVPKPLPPLFFSPAHTPTQSPSLSPAPGPGEITASSDVFGPVAPVAVPLVPSQFIHAQSLPPATFYQPPTVFPHQPLFMPGTIASTIPTHAYPPATVMSQHPIPHTASVRPQIPQQPILPPRMVSAHPPQVTPAALSSVHPQCTCCISR